MRNRSSLGLAVALLLLSGWGAWSALAWPLKAKLFPLVIAIPLFCLAAAEIVWVLIEKPEPAAGAGAEASAAQPRALALRRTLLAAGWTVGFFVLIILLGFSIAVPVLVFAYLKLQGKEGWIFTTVFTVAVWGFFYGLFDLLLHLPFPPGILFPWAA